MLRGEKDPDDLIREKGLDAFLGLLRASLPLWDILWERETGNVVADTAGEQIALEQKLITIIRTIKDPTVQRSYLNICRLELARLFWQATKARRKQLKVSSELRLNATGRRGIKIILLGLLVHYPELVEEKADAVCRVTFETDLDAFWTTLYDLLVVYKELSVQLIYEKMKPKFFDILEEIHGHKDENRNRGYNLMKNFPIVKIDPPVEFISRCVDHLVDVLYVDQMTAEIDDAMDSAKQAHSPNDDEGARLLQLVREYHLHLERANKEGIQLAEEADSMKKPVLGPTEYFLPT
jgi:DNA primase